MDLAHDVVQSSFARPICTHGERTHLHAANAAEWRPQHDEFWLLGIFEQGFHGLEEEQGPVGVGLDVVLDRGKGDCGEGREVVGDACIGDDDVEMGDFLLFEERREVGCVFFVLGVVFGNDEVTLRAFGEARQGFGGFVGRVADGSDNSDGGAGEERADEGSAETSMDVNWRTWGSSQSEIIPLLAPVMR